MERTAGLMKPRYLIPITYLAIMAVVLAVPWVEGGSTPQPWLWLLSAVVVLAMAVGWCALGDRIAFPDIHTVFRRKYRRYREGFKALFGPASKKKNFVHIEANRTEKTYSLRLDRAALIFKLRV